MRVQLIKVHGKTVGYVHVAEDEGDNEILKEIQQLNFLASSKKQRIEYDAVTLNEKNKVSKVIFLQREYAILPDHNPTKKVLYDAVLRKEVNV